MHLCRAQDILFNEKNFPNDRTGLEEAISNYEKGDRSFFQGPQQFNVALPYYLKAYEFNPNNADLNFKIGKIYKNMNRPHEAQSYFIKAMSLDKNPIYRMEGEIIVAEVYHLDGKWDEAIAQYKDYRSWMKSMSPKKLHMQRGEMAHEIRWTTMRIQQCENGKTLTMDTVPVLLENMGKAINTEFPEYSAVTNEKEDFMVFTSRRPGSTGGKMPPGEVWQYEDIYYSQRTKDGWQSALRLPGEVNTDNHEAPVWLSANGDKMIIYRPTNNGDLYLSELKEGEWSRPEALPFVNSSYRETHASMSPDGKIIYFTSDNPKYEKVHRGEKGFFNMDIYKVEYDDAAGRWKEPVQLEDLNTEFDEECPFMMADGKTMYFSSQGHTSIGGFDIFKTELKDGKFTAAKNLGYPINSTYNDIFIFFSADGKRGFFDSDRNTGAGEKDIYEMFILSAVRIPLLVQVYDKETNKLITAEVEVTEAGSKPQKLALTSPETGKFESQLAVFKFYKISVKAPGYLPVKGAFNTKLSDMRQIDTTVIRYTAYLEKDNTPVVLKGRVLDNGTKKLLPGTLEATVNGEKIKVVTTADGNYEMELPRNRTYSFAVRSDNHNPVKETLALDSTKKTHDFYLDRIPGVLASFRMNNIYFKTGKTDIADSSMAELKLLKQFLEENPNATVEISAHTDNVGSYESNVRLSERRGNVVVNWLIGKGIDRKRITMKGYSYDRPVATNDTPEGRFLNRRAELLVTNN
jgi:outer membrane protein OmpA-like peptidoglycan-associated protein